MLPPLLRWSHFDEPTMSAQPLAIDRNPIPSPHGIDRLIAEISVFTGRTPSAPLPFRVSYSPAKRQQIARSEWVSATKWVETAGSAEFPHAPRGSQEPLSARGHGVVGEVPGGLPT